MSIEYGKTDSFYPASLTNNTPSGPFGTRLPRRCDREDDFEQKAEELYASCQQRGYKPDLFNQSLAKTEHVSEMFEMERSTSSWHLAETWF